MGPISKWKEGQRICGRALKTASQRPSVRDIQTGSRSAQGEGHPRSSRVKPGAGQNPGQSTAGEPCGWGAAGRSDPPVSRTVCVLASGWCYLFCRCFLFEAPVLTPRLSGRLR